MHKDNRQQLRKQSLLGEPYGSEPNLYDPEKPEEFLYDAELLNAWFWSNFANEVGLVKPDGFSLVEDMYDDDEVTGT